MRKTILLSGVLLMSSTLLFAKSKTTPINPEDFKNDNPKQLSSTKFAISPLFDVIVITNYEDILKSLPTVSDNGISGSWVSSTITQTGPNTFDYKCIFIPSPGQNATSTTRVFTVYTDYILKANNGSGGGNIYNLISINGQFGMAQGMVSVSTDFPENAGSPITIDGSGNATIQPGLPPRTYKILYKATLNVGCGSYSFGYLYVTNTSHPETGRMAPKTEISNELVVYPNPSKNFFNIDLRGTEEKYDKVKVFSVTGALIYEGQLTPGASNTINLSEVGAGYYFAQISSNTNSKTLTIIKE